MKIAVCLSGFIRTFQHTKNSLKNILCKGIQPDLFVHTYAENYYEYSSGNENVVYTIDEIRKIFEGFNVVQLEVENRSSILPSLLEEGKKFSHCRNYGFMIKESSDSKSVKIPVGVRIIDQLRKIELCNNLKKDYEKKMGFTYDYVVRTRMDIFFLDTPDWSKIQENHIYTEVGCTGGYPHDCVIFGKSREIDIFSSRYSQLKNMLLTSTPIKGGNCSCKNIVPACCLCAHGTIQHICDMNNIKVVPNLIRAIIQRSKSKFHVPGIGTQDVSLLNADIRVLITQ